MLVLSRRDGESIVIGTGAGAVLVTLIETQRGKVRLGVTAARDVPVNRQEMLSDEDLRALPEAARRVLGVR